MRISDRISRQQDFWAGLLFVALGVAFALGAQRYELGSAQRMGPAYFPTILGALLALLGTLIAARGLRRVKPGTEVARFHFRPMLLVIGAVLLFAVLLRPFGLVVALIALIVTGSLGGPNFRMHEVIVINAILVGVVLAVFIYALGLTIPVWPAFIER